MSESFIMKITFVGALVSLSDVLAVVGGAGNADQRFAAVIVFRTDVLGVVGEQDVFVRVLSTGGGSDDADASDQNDHRKCPLHFVNGLAICAIAKENICFYKIYKLNTNVKAHLRSR